MPTTSCCSCLILLGCFAVPAPADQLDDLLPKIAKYQYGQNAGNLHKVAEIVVASHKDPARRGHGLQGKLFDLQLG